MKKNLTKIVCLALTLALVLMLGGCGASEKDALLGTWKGEMDMTDVLNQSMASGMDEEMASYLMFDDFTLTLVLTFNEDDTYSMTLDETALDATIKGMKEDFTEGMENYLVDMMASMGVEMSIDEIMSSMDTSMEELVDEAISEEMVESLVSDMASQGKFKAADGKLYLSDGLNYEVDETMYENYTLENDTLTLVSSSDEDVDDVTASLYPMVFKKAA